MFKSKKAFTLAEILVVLTLLGVVAAITIPNTLNNSSKAANKTKIKKAIPVYEQAIENMKIFKNFYTKEDLVSWTDCNEKKSFFKIREDFSSEAKCAFKTNDGLYWDITDLSQTIISLDNEKCPTVSDTDECKNKAFYLTFENSDDKRALIFNKTDSLACATLKFAKIIVEGVSCPIEHISTPCQSPNWSGDYGAYCTNCKNCLNAKSSSEWVYEFDENGKVVYGYAGCTNPLLATTEEGGCSRLFTYENGVIASEYRGCSFAAQKKGCDIYMEYLNHSQTTTYTGCEDAATLTKCTSARLYDGSEPKYSFSSCSDAAKGKGCSAYFKYVNGSSIYYSSCAALKAVDPDAPCE